jgi:hypothetical protein
MSPVARGLLLATLVAASASSIANAQQPYRSAEARANGGYSIPYDSPNYGPHFDPDNDGIGRESCLVVGPAFLRKGQTPAAVGIAVVPHTWSGQDLNVAPVAVSRG